MQRTGQQAGIVCCSDGLAKNQQEQVHNLRGALRQMNISVIMSPYLYQGTGTAKQKAQALMALYDNDDIHDVLIYQEEIWLMSCCHTWITRGLLIREKPSGDIVI